MINCDCEIASVQVMPSSSHVMLMYLASYCLVCVLGKLLPCSDSSWWVAGLLQRTRSSLLADLHGQLYPPFFLQWRCREPYWRWYRKKITDCSAVDKKAIEKIFFATRTAHNMGRGVARGGLPPYVKQFFPSNILATSQVFDSRISEDSPIDLVIETTMGNGGNGK